MAVPVPARRRRRWRLLLLGLLVLPLLPPLAIETAALLLPYPAAERALPPPSTIVLDRDGGACAELASDRGEFHRPLPELPPLLARAVVAVEDRRFAGHHGIDWSAIAAAAAADLVHGRVVRGASTITMQLERLRAAQADAPRRRSLATKLLEAVRARQIERTTAKDAILREWLDRAPFGANLIGAEAASRRWFGVPAADLGLAQAALLAGLPQRPEALRPDRHPAAARERRDTVLALMREQGLIDAAACAAAQAEAVILAPPPPALPGLRGLPAATARADGVLATGLDRAVQTAAAAALVRARDALAGSGDLAAALVVCDRDGTVRATACAGGDPWFDLCDARRSPGSALKPFIYAAAFADGICAPGSAVADLPAAWAGWRPLNIDRAWRGGCTAAEALADSRNIPALELLRRVGVDRAGALLESLGLPGAGAAARRAGLALAVGGIEVSPRALAGAYAALARRAAAGDCAAADVLACLAQPARTAAVSAAAADAGVAWKTGTSSGQRDAWCCAVGARLVAVLWLGVRRGAGTPALLGAEAAAPACLDLLAGLDPGPAPWPRPLPSGGAAVLPEPTLAITAPADGLELVGAPDGGRARLRLSCAGASGAVWWFAGRECLGRADPDGGLWWWPPPGRHALRAVDAAGRSAGVAIAVR